MPTHAAQFASPTHFFPEADAEQERRLKRMEETIRALQANDDSLSGSALDWFMSLKAEDIPTWEDLSRKFTDQYRYCAETPPTLLELSTKEMARGQRFEEYAAKWRAQAAKHIPPISEAQQIQLFHSTLRGLPPSSHTRLNIGLNPLPNPSTIPRRRLHPYLRRRHQSSTIMLLLCPKPLNTNPQLLKPLSRRNESRPSKVNRAVQHHRDPADNTRPY
ncbi:hypothetical protein CRG98_021401, partial [Punica granatum]